MAKQLNVSMNFTANTSQAKSQIQDLSNMLNKIAYSTDIKVNASDISEASVAAKELSYHLKNAYNVKTGNFDLSALNKSLKSAKTDITQLSNKLLTVGKTGQEAFVKLSQTIAQADQPVITMGTHLNNLFTTLKNTLRWQISNSMIMGVTGAIQQAFYYAQDLDKSLNNIRIVTSKSSDEMAKFAKEANAAARSLSTTTTKYTDASLIYYQQGLDDETVKARTDATVKMANVTGDAAETVSSQMTAIWNNFDDGSKKLEYYADVITALGAATASSSAEIAQGLEKFASVADTVGLSYEYATSALATVVAETRQSADVVGTSFKTLFARIEGLKLNGVDEEDGTTLNKYSQALADVGVNIKDANGELKDMDEILNDLGEKWQDLDKDTKVALAQTVGGARQYTQLIALMDNWGEFQKNLGVARGSEGTLDEQAEIYAESWEAAKDRVRASAEGIYDSLINEDFFIDLDNWLAKILDGIGDFIEGIGGAKGVLLGIGTLAVSLLSKRISPMMDKLKSDISIITGGAQKGYQKMSQDMNSKVEAEIANPSSGVEYTEAQKAQLRGNSQLLQAKTYLSKVEKDLTQDEYAAAKFQIEALQAQQNEVLKLAQKHDEVKKRIEEETDAIKTYGEMYKQAIQDSTSDAYGGIASASVVVDNKINGIKDEWQKAIAKELSFNLFSAEDGQFSKVINDIISNQNSAGYQGNLKTILQDAINPEGVFKEGDSRAQAMYANLEGLEKIFPSLSSKFNDFREQMEAANGDIQKESESLEILNKYLETFKIEGENSAEQLQSFEALLRKIVPGFKGFSEAANDASSNMKNAKTSIRVLTEEEKKLKEESEQVTQQLQSSFNALKFDHVVTGMQGITAAAAGLGQVAMAFTTIKSTWETIKDPDASGWEKLSSTFMAISMIIPSLLGTFSSITTVLQALSAEQIRQNKVNELANKIIENTNLVTAQEIQTLDAKTKVMLEQAITQKIINGENAQELIDQLKKIGLNVGEASTQKAVNKTLKEKIALQLEERGIMLSSMPILAAIAAAIGLIILLYKANYNATHKARIEAEKAAESYKEVSEAFNEVKSSVDEVNSSLDGLADRYKSIEDMTYGTTEWGQSVRGLNKEMEELIEKYKLIEGKDWYRDAEGIIRLTDAGQEAARSSANDQLKSAERAKDAAELRMKTTQLAADKEKTLYTNTAKRDKYAVSAFGAFGSGNKYDYVANTLPAEILNQIINALAKNPAQELNSDFLKDLGINDNIIDLIDKDEQLKNSIDELAENTRELNDTYKNDVIDQLLGSKELENIDEDYRTGVLEQIGEGSKEQVEARINQVKNSEQFEQYKANWAKVNNYHYDENSGKLYKADENGAYSTDKSNLVNIDDLDDQVAAWQALNEIVGENEESIKNYVKTVEESKKVWDSVDGIKDAWEKAKEGTNDAKAAMRNFAEENTKAFASILGVSEEAFDEMGVDAGKFASDNLALVEDALKGDEEAVENLRNKFAESELEARIRAVVDDEDFDNIWSQLQDSINYVENTIDNIEVGADINDENFYKALNSMLSSADFASKQMAEDFLNSMGIDAEVEETKVTGEDSTTVTYPRFKFGKWGLPIYQDSPSVKITENTERTVFSVKAGNAKKSVGGDVVRRSSGSGGKTSAPSTPSSSGSGGGGGGSRETKDKDNSEVERYYVINQVLKELTSQMTKLGKEKDRAFGANKLKAINNEIALLQQQKKAQQEYLREAKMYRDTDQAGLRNLFGGQFNAQGIFINYDDIFAKEQKAYNDAVIKYNKSAQADYDKNRLAEAEARWNKFSELAKQYESDLQDVQKAEEDVQDTINEIADKSLEIIQYTVQLKLDMAEDTKKYLDFLLSGAERKEFNVAEQIAITGKTAQVYTDQRAAAAQGLADILGAHGLTTEQAASLTADQLSAMNFTEDEVDTIREYRDTVIEADEALADLADTINEYVTKALDEWMDKLDKTASNYEHLNKLLNDYKNILGLIDQKATGIDRKLIEDLNQAMLDNARNKYESSVESYNALKQLEKQYQAELDDATASGDAQRIAYWTKNMEDLQEKIKDANETMLENWQETLEIAQKNFQETVKATLDSMYDGIGGLANFDLLKRQFEYEKDLADDYIDDFNKAYELNKLNRKIQNSLDDTKGIKNKELLRDLQKEINDLQASGAQISKYDLEYLQKKYEMRKAEIALEEAQNAKTTVRMRQDNEGNWGYVYTADQDNVDNAKQNYEDKLADMYNLTEEYNQSLQDQIIKLLDDRQKAMDDAAAQYANDSEAFAQAMAQIQEFYGEKLAFLSSELGKTFDNNHDLYVHDIQYYQEMTDSNIFNSAMFAQKFDETVLGTLRGMPDTLDELNTNVESSWDRASETVTAAYNTLYDYLYGEQGIAPSITTVTQEATKEITQTSNTARQTITRDTQKMTSDMTEVVNKVVEWQKTWTNNIAAMNTSDAKLIKELGEILTNLTNIGNSKPTPQVTVKYSGVTQLDDLLKKLGQLQSKTVTITTKYVTSGSSGGSTSGSYSGGPSSGGSGPSTALIKFLQGVVGTTQDGGWGPKSEEAARKKYGTGNLKDVYSQVLSVYYTYNKTKYNELKALYDAAPFDTGGYTGEWDSSGKLAILHQKEIVLNKDDTANFLAGISVLRDIVKQIDLRSLAERQTLSNLQVNVPRDSSSTLQQNVVINADFPGVQTHSEIEMAFENLLGKATQFANRKK